MQDIRTHYLDASAIVKLFVKEVKSDILLQYYHSPAKTFSTTSLCFAEAIGVLKAKWLYRKELSQDQYLEATDDLMATFTYETITIDDIEIRDRKVTV